MEVFLKLVIREDFCIYHFIINDMDIIKIDNSEKFLRKLKKINAIENIDYQIIYMKNNEEYSI